MFIKKERDKSIGPNNKYLDTYMFIWQLGFNLHGICRGIIGVALIVFCVHLGYSDSDSWSFVASKGSKVIGMFLLISTLFTYLQRRLVLKEK
jgi:hypothetical protein